MSLPAPNSHPTRNPNPNPTDTPTEILNVPAGNSPVTTEPQPLKPEDRRTGVWSRDVWEAVKRIRPVEDTKNIGTVPCARESLLGGIAGGTGIGAIRYISKRRVGNASNWAVGSFVAISLVMWENCRRKRAQELAQMKLIEKQFAHRHVSRLKPKPGADGVVGVGVGGEVGAGGADRAV